MLACDVELPNGSTHSPLRLDNARPCGRTGTAWVLGAAPILSAAVMLHASPVQAQQNQWQPQAPQYIQCPASKQPLLRIPEIVSQNGFLRGTVRLAGARTRMYLDAQANDPSQCLLQPVRQFQGFAADGTPAVLPGYPGAIPFGYPGYTSPPSYTGNPPFQAQQDPIPGPTLRARLGDIVELTFLNQLGGEISWDTLDRGEKGQGCDQSVSTAKNVYPGADEFPDCLHGSTTGNIHFHGTHTNPQTTGDNVFIEVRPSLRDPDGQPLVTEAVVKPQFDTFFADCERELNKSVLSQWPTTWTDMPPSWRAMQEYLLTRYDFDPVIVKKLWPVDEAQINEGAWPQYYIGAVPYCFRLPAFTGPWPPAGRAHPVAHGLMMEHSPPPLQMGQAPGTHWYHAHKHGSTTLNVENGMTGAFIIEGGYDDALNQFYGNGWTRTQPVLVVNQLGTVLNLFGNGTPRAFSVNGRIQPMLTMKSGEVQLWRIANTSARGGIYVSGFAPTGTTTPTNPQAFTWRQTAQDGVQFNGTNYWSVTNPNLLISPGNRADLLIQAPTTPGTYDLLVLEVRSRCETLPSANIPPLPDGTPLCGANPKQPNPPSPILTVNVTSTQATGNQSQFIPQAQVQAAFPAFLADIGDDEVKATKTVVFNSHPTGKSPRVEHTIDGQKFDGNVGQVVLLNTVEEWKIVNKSINGKFDNNGNFSRTDPPGVVDHPFHIHINPFQITEFFDPNEVLPGTSTYKYVFGVSTQPPPPYNRNTQCLLYIDKPDTWKPCDPFPLTNLIWWDVFAIPSARAVSVGGITKSVDGYFKMRSRFVDYAGQYVMHCHILVHEDRGMMTVVEVAPFTTPYSHQ